MARVAGAAAAFMAEYNTSPFVGGTNCVTGHFLDRSFDDLCSRFWTSGVDSSTCTRGVSRSMLRACVVVEKKQSEKSKAKTECNFEFCIHMLNHRQQCLPSHRIVVCSQCCCSVTAYFALHFPPSSHRPKQTSTLATVEGQHNHMAGPKSPARGRGRGKGGRGGKGRAAAAAASPGRGKAGATAAAAKSPPKRRSSRGAAAAAAAEDVAADDATAEEDPASQDPGTPSGDSAKGASASAPDADTPAPAPAATPAPAPAEATAGPTTGGDDTADSKPADTQATAEEFAPAPAPAATGPSAVAPAEEGEGAATAEEGGEGEAAVAGASPHGRGRAKGRVKGGRGGGRGGPSPGRGGPQSPGRGGRGRGGGASPGGGRGRGRGGGSGSSTLARGPPYVPGGTTAATGGARKKSPGKAKGTGGAGHRTGAAVPAGAAAAGERKRKRTGGLVTITEINEDELMAVANQNWAPGSKAAAKGYFKPKLVMTICYADTDELLILLFMKELILKRCSVMSQMQPPREPNP